MNQHGFHFHSDEEQPNTRQLDMLQQQSLIDLMVTHIVTTFQSQEKSNHD
ncbi:MAG: hypothetical protein ACI845_001301 [Gammaproteobacteria bacterium]|jgi:hypothetical protein